jgi:type VI protein secretion system component Hcp
LLVWAPAALASVQSTLTLSGGSPPIPSMTVQSFAWGVSQSGTGGYTGRAHVESPSVSGGEFSVTMVSGKQTGALALAAGSGSTFPTASLISVHPPSATPYMQTDFTDVQVVDVSVDTMGGADSPTLRVTFAYRNADIQYTPESSCSLGARSWMGLSQVTPAADPATGGSAVDALTPFLPIQLGGSGPGVVTVDDPSQADSLLKVDGANGLSNLRAQTLATRLNVTAGALDPSLVQSQLDQADALLARTSRGPGTRSTRPHRPRSTSWSTSSRAPTCRPTAAHWCRRRPG